VPLSAAWLRARLECVNGRSIASLSGTALPGVIDIRQRSGPLAIERFADDVGVTGVTRCLLDELSSPASVGSWSIRKSSGQFSMGHSPGSGCPAMPATTHRCSDRAACLINPPSDSALAAGVARACSSVRPRTEARSASRCCASDREIPGQGTSRPRSGRLPRAIRRWRARLETSRWVSRAKDPGPKRPHATKAAMAR
jgi:hypothetical protein